MSKPGKDMDETKTFDPQKYAMVFCPNCNGSGRVVKVFNGFQEVCPRCGGFGLLKREIKTFGGDKE